MEDSVLRPRVVSSIEELGQWFREVQSDPELRDNRTLRNLILAFGSDEVLDTETWRAPYRAVYLMDASGYSQRVVYDHIDDVLESKYLIESGTAKVPTGRGEEEVPTYALFLP